MRKAVTQRLRFVEVENIGEPNLTVFHNSSQANISWEVRRRIGRVSWRVLTHDALPSVSAIHRLWVLQRECTLGRRPRPLHQHWRVAACCIGDRGFAIYSASRAGVAQWQSSGFPSRWLRVRSPSPAPGFLRLSRRATRTTFTGRRPRKREHA
jgi:hypothetical protein